MGNSQAGAFRSQFESVDLREATKNNLWQHYRCVKNVSMSTLSTSAATTAQQEDRFPLSPRGAAAETTTAVVGRPSPSPTTTATSSSSQSGGTVAVSTVKTSLTMLQLNVQHNSFKASLSAPRSPNPDAALPSQYKLQYRMLDTCYHAAQWCQRHPHPSLLRVEDICFSPEDKTLCVVLPYASLDPVAPRLPSLTAMEILYGLTKVAEGLAHLHSNGVAHRALSWNAVYVSTVHPVKGAPPTVFSALAESGQWVLSNIQFMGGGVTSSDEVSALKNFLLEVRGLRESSAVPSNCVAPEWNNPMGATVSWTSVPCGAGDVYSFGAMILSLLPEGATQRQSAASLSTIFSSSVASSLMPEDLNVNDVTSQRVTMELRKFAERCMSEDPMKRPHVEEFFELRCCRHSVFVQTMQSLDHLRSTPNLRDRLRLFYLLHVELLKIPYEALVQKVLPRLLQLRVWRDPAAEYFLRHLLTPLGPSTYTDLGDHPAVIGAPLDPAHLVELVRLHGDLSKQTHKRAPWLGVLLNGESLSSSHNHSSKADIAFRIAVRRCADWYGPSSTTSASASVSMEQQVVKKALREYQLFDLDSALEIALFDGRSGGARTEMGPSPNPKDPQSCHSITDSASHADAEATAAGTQDEEDVDELKRSGGGGSGGATEAGREYDIPLLPVVGLVLNSDFRALVVPFLVKLFNVVVACGAQPEVLLRTGIHARVLVALLRNMDAYLNGVSVSQVVVPCLIPFLRVCLTHPEADIVLSALMALKHLAQRIEGAIAKQPPPNSAAASSAQQQEQDDEEGKAGTTEEGEAGRASETVEGSDSSSSPKPKSDPSPRDSGASSLLETLLAAARALCAIFNKEVLSIACSDAVPSLRLAALILLVKTILRPASHGALDPSQKDGASNRPQAATSSASLSIGAGRTEAIAALCHCFWIGLNGKLKMPPTAVQSVETGMRRVAYRAAIFALKNTGMFLPAELSDDIIPAALNAYYQWVSGGSSTASNNSSNTTRKSSNANSAASIDGGCPLETTLLQLVHAATEYLSKDAPLHDDGDSKDPASKKQQHRSRCWTTREGKSTAAFRCGAIAAVQGSVQPRQGGADGGKGGPLLLPGRYTPLRLTRSEFDQLPYVSFQDFDQEWNARGGIFLPAVAVSSGSSAATHTFTCSTKAHPLAILLPSRSETLLCPAAAAAASSLKGKTSSSIFGSASEDGMNSLPRRGGKQQSTSGVPINAPSQSQEQQVTPHPSDPAEKDARSLPAVQPNHSSSSSYSSSSSKPPSRKRIHVDLEQFESTTAVLASTTDHHEPALNDDVPPAAVNVSSSLRKEESSGADVVVPSAASRDVLTSLQAVETDELSSSLGSTARSDVAAPVATAANPTGRATSSSSKTSAAPRRKKPSFTGGRPGGSLGGGADPRVIGEDDL